MELTYYDIIKGPVISDKAYKLNRKLNQLVLKVHMSATKPMVKDALEKLFNVKVAQVNTLIRTNKKSQGTMKRSRVTPKTINEKIAYVTLAEGYSIDLFESIGAGTGVGDQVKAELS